jgi:hypothetical protein
LKRLIVTIIASTLVLAVAVPWRSPVAAFAVSSGTSQTKGLLQAAPRSHRAVCGLPGPHAVRCNADVQTNASGVPLTGTAPPYGGYGPTQFHTGYQLPCTPGGAIQSICSTPSSFGPQTVALIEAYLDPTAANDLAVYSSQYGLPACTTANGCLSIVNENGGSALPTTTDASWALETSLDIEVAHAICQTCKILLVEATTSSYYDITTAVDSAAGLGATAISNSYGSVEWSNESSFDPYYNHPGIAVVASSGDGGYGSQYPAVSPGVIAVGGTTLHLNADGTYNSETVWGSSGSGCSQYEPANSWQMQVSDWSQTGCGTNAAATDVSADADPSTGAAIYAPYNGGTGWYLVGGTSLSAPLVAAVYALAGGVPAGTNAQSVPYTDMNGSSSHDVTTGSNGTCNTIMCTAGVGYDGPSGLGTPHGTVGFGGTTSAPPPATLTPTTVPPTATSVAPTSTPKPTATSVPPTSTPKPTATSVPPTSTPKPITTSVPPTATPVSNPTSTPTATPCVLNKAGKCK